MTGKNWKIHVPLAAKQKVPFPPMFHVGFLRGDMVTLLYPSIHSSILHRVMWESGAYARELGAQGGVLPG